MVISDIAGFGEIGKTLIQEIAQGIRDANEPKQIRKIAEAERDALIIKSVGEAEALRNIGKAETYVENLKRRSELINGKINLIEEQNLESVINLAEPSLPSDFSAVKFDDLWMYRFIQASKTAFDEQVQMLWAKILTMEFETPGLFHPRTLKLLSDFSRKDAELVKKVLSFSIFSGVSAYGVLYYQTSSFLSKKYTEFKKNIEAFYEEMGLSYSTFLYLDDLGVINFGVGGGVSAKLTTELEEINSLVISFQGENIEIMLPPEREIKLPIIPLTSFGEQLSLLIDKKDNEQVDKIIEFITTLGYKIKI